MLNLLIISGNPKAETIKNLLQPLFRIKINLVTDFDHGLKDVFEKRPSMVVIQDQIAGVSGESVARHIQLLLGSEAPAFILLHEGNKKIKPIGGLFDHILDLTEPEVNLVRDIQTIIKSKLGSQWEKIAVSVKMDTAAIADSDAVPDGLLEEVEKAGNELSLELESTDKYLEEGSSFFRSQEQTETPQTESALNDSGIILTKSDEIAQLMSVMAEESREHHDSTAIPQQFEVEMQAQTGPPPAERGKKPQTPANTGVQNPHPNPVDAHMAAKNVTSSSSLEETKPPVSPTSRPAAGASLPTSALTSKGNAVRDPASMRQSPADFRILSETPVILDKRTEAILPVIDSNLRSRFSLPLWLVMVVAVAVSLGAGGYLLFKPKSSLTSPSKQGKEDAGVSMGIDAPKHFPQAIVQNLASTARKSANITTVSTLPSFIPLGGRDIRYSSKNPGWERYAGKVYEFRIFRDDGGIKALQVMVAPGKTISDSFLNAVLREMAGNDAYVVSSGEQRGGYLIQKGRVGQQADLLIYRTLPSGPIRAFVLSLS